jgi:hypothetical protein
VDQEIHGVLLKNDDSLKKSFKTQKKYLRIFQTSNAYYLVVQDTTIKLIGVVFLVFRNAFVLKGTMYGLHQILLSLAAIHAVTAFLSSTTPTPTRFFSRGSSVIQEKERAVSRFSSTSEDTQSTKAQLLELVLEKTPRNAPTSASTTEEILKVVRELEEQCPTPDTEVLQELAGTWELLWTTQDRSRPESQRPFSWINPLENQSYSNNPGGRRNPVLPRRIQDILEQLGVIDTSTPSNTAGSQSRSIRSSTQSIDLTKGEVRNVVGFVVPSVRRKQQRRASLTVSVKFKPNSGDSRRVDVKFQACRVRISDSPININIPLGIIGPRGWLRTAYIDDDLRITRGHKGSVFVLSRPAKSPKK